MAEFANNSRGLVIAGTDFQYRAEGAYAAIFVDQENGKARKVYFKRHGRREMYTIQAFDCETEAYEIASNSAELRDLIPLYVGKIEGIVIWDKNGADVTDEFYADRVIEMEYITGDFQKIAEAKDGEEIKARFIRLGICGMSDASVVVDNSKIIKVIDFGTAEVEPEWDDIF